MRDSSGSDHHQCHTWGMPDASSPALDVLTAIGVNPARIRILQVAARSGPVTADQLMEVTGLARSSVRWHLKPLLAAGLLEQQPDPHFDRTGTPRMVWSADPGRLREVFGGALGDLFSS